MMPEDRKKLMDKLLDNSLALAKSVPSFKLKVSLKGSFWKQIENVL
jgi:hypothetical protein